MAVADTSGMYGKDQSTPECLISVIIPCFNAEEFLANAVQSVLGQGIPQTEIIVVDDRSTDHSRAVAESLAAGVRNIRLIEQPVNAGPAAARNAGLRAARGRLICFMDADDEYAPGFFGTVAPLFATDPNLAAVITGVELVGCRREVHPVQLHAVVGSLPSNVMVRKSVANLIGGFPEDPVFRGRAAGEDIAFKTALATLFKVVECRERFLRYRFRSGSHLDFFLDRSSVVDGKLILTARTIEEDNGTLAAAQRSFMEQVRERVAAARRGPDLFAEAQNHHQAQRFSQAESLYRRVVESDPKHLPALYHLGLACVVQGKLIDAVESFHRVLAIVPNHVEAITQLGVVLARLRRLPEAVARLRQAIALNPRQAKAHNNLGVALAELGQNDEALDCWKRAVECQPDYAEAHFNLAVALADRRQVADAIASYRRALELRHDYPEALSNLGLLLFHDRRPGEAVVLLQQALRHKAEYPEAKNNLGLALADLGRFGEAMDAYDQALRQRPTDAELHMNRGTTLASAGRVEEALASYQQALRLRPDMAEAHWSRSLALLSCGDYERGWLEYEWRWKRARAEKRTFAKPRWDGSCLGGKTILLWCEQGLGDMIHFVRYALLLKKQGATVWLECPAKMIPLLGTCRGVDRVLAEGTPLPDFDYQAPLMSLPLLCGTLLNNVPSETPYLRAFGDLVQYWRGKLGASSNFKIGVAWQGNPKHRFDRHRSFPVHWFRSLAGLGGVELYSLQKGSGTEQLKSVRYPISDLGSSMDESGGAFQETAALMQALDLVITCDSALAHLAGALGRPVWVALSTNADWRWLQDVEYTLWYPTMRLFRQAQLGHWGPVFEHIRQEVGSLCKRCANRNSM